MRHVGDGACPEGDDVGITPRLVPEGSAAGRGP